MSEPTSQYQTTPTPLPGQQITFGLASGTVSIADAAALTGHLNVRWFGAKGDGVTDDTSAIQKAINSVGAEGGVVYFPRGLYIISAALTVGGVGNPVNGPTLRGEVRVGPNSLGAIVVPSPDDPTAGGSFIEYAGASGDQTMLDIRNADSGVIENLGFYAVNLAKNCVRMSHDVADVRPIYNWKVNGCAFFDAKEYNFNVEGTGTGYGDASGLTFDNPVFWGSYNAHTIAHYRCTTQYTLGVTMNNPYLRATDIGGGSCYPTNGCSMTGGTVTMVGGGAALFTGALFYLRGASGLDFPAFNAVGLEFQGGPAGKYIDAVDTGSNPAQRSSVITGSLMDSIISPFTTEIITWNVTGQAALVLNGVTTFADINVVAALATVVANGVVLYQYHTGVGPSGGGRAAAFTGHTERVTGTWIVGRQDGTGGLDKTHVIVPPTYADNAAAVTGGQVAGDVYKTSTGIMMVCLG